MRTLGGGGKGDRWSPVLSSAPGALCAAQPPRRLPLLSGADVRAPPLPPPHFPLPLSSPPPQLRDQPQGQALLRHAVQVPQGHQDTDVGREGWREGGDEPRGDRAESPVLLPCCPAAGAATPRGPCSRRDLGPAALARAGLPGLPKALTRPLPRASAPAPPAPQVLRDARPPGGDLQRRPQVSLGGRAGDPALLAAGPLVPRAAPRPPGAPCRGLWRTLHPATGAGSGPGWRSPSLPPNTPIIPPPPAGGLAAAA